MTETAVEEGGVATNRDVERLMRNKPFWDLNYCIQDHPVKINIFNKN